MDTVDRLVTTAVNAWPLIVLLAGIIYPFLPGPVRAWLQARRIEAESNTHLNDTALLLGTLWRGYQDARSKGGDHQSALLAGLSYAQKNRPDLVAKLGATPPVMEAMLGGVVQDHLDRLAAGALSSAKEARPLAMPEALREWGGRG
ncbi:hypothetical protein HMPREF9946_00110 [Acetobacteraceae bacterium AT-5844]|nr:hypothetical protein HMPREF9946_00110 [Acetobacteraceae bacterium AT-5844]